MAALQELLGATLTSNDGETTRPTQEALSGCKAVGLYFSAHWCPPCRGFTPKLGEMYTNALKGKGLEVVFLSSDKDEAAWKEYLKEMPWLALPYVEREKKEELSKKYKVQGIPTLVIIDGVSGELISKDGREKVTQDPEGEEFPWHPKPLKEVLGDTFVGPKGAQATNEAFAGKVLGLYFSAHWCPPCRGFTPVLAATYEKLKAKGTAFEVVFVSSDKDEAQFDEYFATMPWLALPYPDRKRKAQLSGLFEVRGIPTLVLLDQDLNLISKEGTGAVKNDPEGAEFPWMPKPVNDFAQSCDGIDEKPAVVVLAEGAGKDAQEGLEAALTVVAQEVLEKNKSDPEFLFFINKGETGPGSQVRKLCGLGEPGSAAQAVLLDIDDNGAFYEVAIGDGNKLTAAGVRELLTKYATKSLERKQLKQG